MNKPKIALDIISEEEGYSATGDIAGKFIGIQGDTEGELKQNILEAVNLAFSGDGYNYTLDEIELRHLNVKPERNLH
ncbi:hypothetical protein GCM10010967_01400 [Dyadobacter beijingensis]|uniref:Uncharacterized protein n=1 Tax=Dyadobacter beijingensis TaxID=365489 RepID=A0ABQ2HCD1_9BACT|nr:hypothetical protein [Dyadobacter beijingensis]GGM73578.1 hypothetical protein GCM10010967_01400 [Dyadobacter beijingensis]